MDKGILPYVVGTFFIVLAIALALAQPNGITTLQFAGYSTSSYANTTNGVTTVILSGQAEAGYARGIGEFTAINNTEIAMNVINPTQNNFKMDPLLLNNSFLEEGGYIEDGAIPVIIKLTQCSESKPTGKKGGQTFSSAKSVLSSEVKEYKIDLKSVCSVSAIVELSNLDDLIDLDVVSKIYLDQKYTTMLNDSIPIIHADDVWNLSDGENNINGTGITIAILDTGLNFSHPDFYEKNILSTSFVPWETVDDNNAVGHGTHCAGIAAGTGNASDGKFIGVAPGADLMIGKVMSNFGYGYTSWIISGIEWAMNPNNYTPTSDGSYITPMDWTPPDKADVISLSLGGASTDGNDPLSLAVDQAVDAGIVVVVAAGNAGTTGPMSVSSPGTARKVITVGASNKNDVIAPFSGIGPTEDGRLKPEIVAPGVNICSTKAIGFVTGTACENDNYWPLSGTSMATPHVAGAAALLLQKHPDWTPEMVKSAFVLTAVDLNASIVVQGSGRIDVYKAINTPILTNPAVLNMGFVNNNTTSAELTITNIFDTELEIALDVSELTNLENISGNWADVNESNIIIQPGENYTVSINVDITEDVEGFFYGYLNMETNGESYRVPMIVSRVGRLVIGVILENGTLSKPSYAVVYNPNNFSRLMTWYTYYEDTYNHTFFLNSGTYTLHIFGDNNDFDLNYVVGDEFELGKGEYKELIFNLSDAKKIEVPTYSKDGVVLDVYRYEYMVVCYYPTNPTKIKMLNVLWGIGESITNPMYVSESTCANRSIQIGVRGSPTRGHLYERAPGEDLYNISGKEWMWRWENRDISDEDYLLAWNIKGDVTEDINLTLDMNKTSIFKEFYNFAGYAPFTYDSHPQDVMARVVFWLSPDWFESWSYMKRINPPVNRTLYVMGNDWTYQGYIQVDYPYNGGHLFVSQTEYPEPYNSNYYIKINDTSINKTHYFGTAPYQLPYFDNYADSNRIYFRTNAPLIGSYNHSVFAVKAMDNALNPSIYIYQGRTLVYSAPEINTHNIWRYGVAYNCLDINRDRYTINLTLPLRYSVYDSINAYAEINFSDYNVDVNPPKPLRFWIDPAFDYNVSIPVEIGFLDETPFAKIYYKTDLQDWTLVNISNNGTYMKGFITITDGASKNIDLKIKAADWRGNNITYTLDSVSVLYRDIYFNLLSNQTSAYPGDALLLNGTVYDPLDTHFSGIKLKYFVNGEYIDFDRTDFAENLNTIDTRMPSYVTCMGCFEKEFAVPTDIKTDQLNFTVLFEGSGSYKLTSKSIFIDMLNSPFRFNVSEYTKVIVGNSSSTFNFGLKNNLDVTGICNLTINSNVSWNISEIPEIIEILSGDEIQLNVTVAPTNITQITIGEINVTAFSSEHNYSKTITLLITANPLPSSGEEDGGSEDDGGGSSGGSGISIPSITDWTTDTLDDSFVVNNQINFGMGGDKHTITIKALGLDYVTIEINSTSISVTVKLGETKEVDVNGDGINDVAITLNKINLGKADISFEKLEGAKVAVSKEQFTTDGKINFFNVLEAISAYYQDEISFNVLIEVLSNYYIS